MPKTTAKTLNAITSRIIEGRNRHSPGARARPARKPYLPCLTRDLADTPLRIQTQHPIPLRYKGLTIDCAYRADLIVEGSVLVELKAIEALAPIHNTQVITYLRLGNYPVGLLLNFGARTMKAGIKRLVNNFPER